MKKEVLLVALRHGPATLSSQATQGNEPSERRFGGNRPSNGGGRTSGGLVAMDERLPCCPRVFAHAANLAGVPSACLACTHANALAPLWRSTCEPWRSSAGDSEPCATFVWFDEDDIAERRLDIELEHMFSAIAAQCAPASTEHIDLVKSIKGEQRGLSEARASFEALADKTLATLPGQHSPLDPTRTGAAKHQFVSTWEAALTDLRHLVKIARDRPSPSWVSRDAHPAFIQDQATEHWYHQNIRTVGQDQIDTLHRQNRTRIDAAIEEVFANWAGLQDSETWSHWVNHAPMQIRERLSPVRLKSLSKDDLLTIVSNSHALRETARHVPKAKLKLSRSEEGSMDERFERFADLLYNARNDAGRDLGEVLAYVIWGDAETTRCAERIWDALHDPARSFPYIGEHTLGELVGYGRRGLV
jgi:hypothetical protein